MKQGSHRKAWLKLNANEHSNFWTSHGHPRTGECAPDSYILKRNFFARIWGLLTRATKRSTESYAPKKMRTRGHVALHKSYYIFYPALSRTLNTKMCVMYVTDVYLLSVTESTITAV
jgi:hypothetical protein